MWSSTTGISDHLNQMSNMYAPGGKFNNAEIFLFPLSSQGIETVRSVFELMSLLQNKFQKTYKNRPEIQCEYEFSFPRFYSYVQGLEYIKLVAHCKFCSHQLVYFKNLSFQQCFKLIAFRKYHVHTKDPNKIREVYVKTCRQAPRVYRYEPYHLRMLKVKSEKHKPGTTPLEYLKSLPMGLRVQTKMKLMQQKYNLTDSEFNSVLRQMNSEYQVSLKTLFDEFDQQGFQYSYLPKNILEVERRYMQDQTLPHYSFRPDNVPDVEEYEPNCKSIHFVDEKNPHIPNILLIVTPEMKKFYLDHGQYVGFDLTFSIIREKPTHSKEYLVGVFGGTNQSKRILIYGLVITNNQSVQAYKYICTEFFKIMGRCPSTVITDEEQPLYYALKALKKEGIFTGQHLFDMFHILKKFRKASDGNSFQLYRKLMHGTTREEYRLIFKQLMKEINNDKQLNILRVFDMNSEKYCYSQILPSLVGSSISNSINQKFHDILKSNLTFESKYIKAVKVMMIVSKDINQPKEPDLEMHPDEENLNIPFLKTYRTSFSSKTFKIMVREVARSGNFLILTEEQEKRANLIHQKLEEPRALYPKKLLSLNRDAYYIKTRNSYYHVFKKYQQDIPSLNDKQSATRGKWHCLCQFQEKTGIICSHLAKVLIYRGESFMNNMHPRWLIKPNTITKRLLDYKYVAKFLNLRSRHKVRIKGWKKGNRVLDNFYRNMQIANEEQSSQAQSIAEELSFQNDDGFSYESEYQSLPSVSPSTTQVKLYHETQDIFEDDNAQPHQEAQNQQYLGREQK